MIAYFPPPYEDELLYSWLARYYSKSGYMAYTLAAEDLFSNKHTKPSIEFISRLTTAALEATERYTPRAMLIEKHTMFPYYARFLDRERRRRAFDAILNMEEGYFGILCVTKNKECIQRCLRYCPMCVIEDRSEHGEAYWHRIHQMRGVNVCPIHGCDLFDTDVSIDSKGSPALITAEETIAYTMQQYHTCSELEWRLARYIADVFRAEVDMQSDVSVGGYLHSRMEGTKYLSQRGEKRNMALLYADFQKHYTALPVQSMQQWQMQKVFSGDRVNTVDVCALAMFLNVSPSDLVHVRLPERSQIDTFDEEIRRLHAQGMNYRQIAKQMNASYDVVKAIGEGLYGKYHYCAENPQKGGAKKFDWAQIDEEALPKIREIIRDLQNDPDGKPQRISVGRIEHILGWPKKRLRQCPTCVREIERYALSQEEYWRRLVDWATNKLISEGKTVNITPDTPSTEPEKEKKKKVKITSGTWHIRAGAGTKYDVVGYAHEGDTFDYLGKSGSWNAVSYKGSKRWIYNEGSKIVGFSKGGYVEDLQEIARRQGDDIFTINTLKRGEAVLEPKLAKGFVKFVGNLPEFEHSIGRYDHDASLARIRSVPPQANQTVNNDNKFEVNIEIDHVQDYNDFMNKMRDDRKFERMIEIMSINKLGGNKQGSAAKRNCKWG